MPVDLMKRLQEAQGDISRGQRAIAAYILEHYDRAAFMTANRLGQEVGVSESTVVRFAMRLGYEGYPELQRALHDQVRNRLSAVQRFEVTTEKMNDQNILRTVMNEDMQKISATMNDVDQEAFNSAVRDTIGARRIYILGMRSCAGLAAFLGFYFQLIFDTTSVVIANGGGEPIEQLLGVGAEDVVYVLSFPRYSSTTLRTVRFARNRGAKIVAITDSEQSPIAQYASYALYAQSSMASFVDSLVAPMSIINALLIAIGMQKKEAVARTFQTLDKIWEDYGVYERPEALPGERERGRKTT